MVLTFYSPFASDLVYAGSWDASISVSDPRANKRVGHHVQSERVVHMDLVGNRLVVALAPRRFNIYDIRNMKDPEVQRESSLRFMTAALACMTNGEGAHFILLVLIHSSILLV